ncbi:hypothetical protein [Paenibacillus sp. FSL R7-0128]|uniref:hypothetical protein n=1 Tax=Paenibacillus sp. FSL R7-0128 TaxID=2954529 RepID=UPI0030FAD041
MKLIDADKLLEWLNAEYKKLKTNPYDDYSSGKRDMLDIVEQRVEDGTFSPTPPVQPDTPKHGDRVLHGIYGMGTVVSGVYIPAPTVIVDLDNSARFHPVPITELEVITDDQR